ncbi:sulfotransferase [Gracilimonas mengyeensis]|uniref:Sulfotransferase family protein n=1 Tax=Gracilimonas mengyeensis TaxID=1302730 RepID=A0A521EGS8_9BACT|nr:sulfotransferase [Gracilimonas mengyeensis]SMO83129.1 Sulfotransferase family protein [Gracilimonas mengyeensis]
MNIFVTGLRRSGTTILFDILSEQAKIKAFYEPLSAAYETIGGGSGEKDFDLNERIRVYREEVIEKKDLSVEPDHFNYGAPKNYHLELSSKKFDDHHKEYLEYLIESTDQTLLKFVRATFLMPYLNDIAPDSYLIHIQKNPLRFATSHIFGIRFKRQSFRGKVAMILDYLKPGKGLQFENTDPDYFFSLIDGFNSWSQENLVHSYLDETGRSHLKQKPAYYKLLLLWKEWNEKMVTDGRKLFGDRFISIEHEQLCRNTKAKLAELSDFLDIEFDDKLMDWALTNLRRPRPIYAQNDPRWEQALKELDMDLRYLEK